MKDLEKRLEKIESELKEIKEAVKPINLNCFLRADDPLFKSHLHLYGTAEPSMTVMWWKVISV